MDEMQEKELVEEARKIRWVLKEASTHLMVGIGALLLIAAGVLVLAFRGCH